MERKQFTFYASYYEAISSLPKSSRSDVYSAICEYALFGKETELTGAKKAVFAIAKPTIDSGRAKATARMKKQAENDDSFSQWEEEHSTSGDNKNKDKNKDKNKSKSKSKEKKEDILPIELNTSFSDPVLQSAFDDWIAYKKERNESYKPTGLKNLVSEIQRNADQFGSGQVARLIRTCMASGWRGIIFDRLKNNRPIGNENVFLEMLNEERGIG